MKKKTTTEWRKIKAGWWMMKNKWMLFYGSGRRIQKKTIWDERKTKQLLRLVYMKRREMESRISDRRPWYLFWEELDQQGGGIETVISTFYNLGLCSRCDTSLPEGFGVVYWIELWSSVQNSAKARADVLGLMRTVEFYQSEKFLKFS